MEYTFTDHHIYDRVILIGVDGAGKFFTQTDTPNIDRIFAHGAYNHNTVTAYPTISAQCWGSMLHGVSPQAHRFTNGLISDHPVPENFPYASVFKVIRGAYPDAVLASVSNWNPINTGIIEQGLNVITGTGNDDEVCDRACEIIKNDDPKFLFVQLDSVDGAGHRYGYGSKGHLDAITYADLLIGKMHAAAAENGRLENTLFLVTADHGGSPDGHHGGDTDAERIVSFFAVGKSVIPGEFGYMEIRDTASVIAFAFGIRQPANWSGRIPEDLFTDAELFDRPSEAPADGSRRFTGIKSLPVPTADGEKLSDFIDINTLRCYFPFDGNADDQTGKCKTEVNGKIYYTNGFLCSAATLDDCTVTGSPISLGTDSYTFCAWLKLDQPTDNENRGIFSSVDPESNKGICFYIENGRLFHEIHLGKEAIVYSHPLPYNYVGNLFHFICSYCRRDDELCYYYDFTLETDKYSDIRIDKELVLDGGAIQIGAKAPVTVDELMIFDHKLSDPEIDALERYYTKNEI